MLRHLHHRRLLAAVATTAALAATAPAVSAMPIRESVGSPGEISATEPEEVRIVRVQVDEGLDWGDAGIGAAVMLAFVLVGFGGAHTLTNVPGHGRSTAQL